MSNPYKCFGDVCKFKGLTGQYESMNGQYGLIKKETSDGKYRIMYKDDRDIGVLKDKCELVKDCPNKERTDKAVMVWPTFKGSKTPAIHWVETTPSMISDYIWARLDSPYHPRKHPTWPYDCTEYNDCVQYLKATFGWGKPKLERFRCFIIWYDAESKYPLSQFSRIFTEKICGPVIFLTKSPKPRNTLYTFVVQTNQCLQFAEAIQAESRVASGQHRNVPPPIPFDQTPVEKYISRMGCQRFGIKCKNCQRPPLL